MLLRGKTVDNYQIIMFTMGGLPLAWGIFSTLRKRRKESLAKKENKLPNLVSISGVYTDYDGKLRSCGKCNTNLGKARFCLKCGLCWCRKLNFNIAYRYKKPPKKKIISLIRAQDKGEK